MGTYHIAICDDDIEICIYIKNTMLKESEKLEIESFSSEKELLMRMEHKPYFDLLYLDIYLQEENGVEIARKVREISPQTQIAFITTSREFAIEAFEVQALHYLVKPVTEEKIKEVLQRVVNNEEKKTEGLYIKIDRQKTVLRLADVMYLKSENHRLRIVMYDGREILTYMALKVIEGQLGEDFLKIKRGFIVNMDYIECIAPTFCVLKNGMDLDLSRMSRVEINKKYDFYILRKVSERKVPGEIG